ncbi:dTDP-glucose 46-dehydratase protein [Marine Group I thaumarchaeote SCGC AAA799-B03]|uniref:dTDP-glucose 46-dehydratase protein n=1 Tax=Marine Group I thaumarchaeote SCGC AAA799-B03 TaxID=1502289 RepID=A0A087S918_9ARCH|nr:dTDP-glucose 46-dehydratase protein [Marine Group I thaumarchaeote SCGC AAA799-B03]
MINKVMQTEIKSIIQELDEESHLDGKNIVVTGCSGFLGSWLCDILVNSNAHVIGIDNFASGKAGNISHLQNNPNFEFHKQDVKEFYTNQQKIDLIFHLASRASPEEYMQQPIETLEANSFGLNNMLDIAHKHDSILVYFSTSEIYGDAKIFPTQENYWGNVNPVGPRSCYDEGKRFGEALCKAYSKQYDMDVRIIRIFNTYGPRIRFDGPYGRAIPRFISQALANEPITVFGDGSQTRSFCYVTDLIKGIILFALKKEARNQIANLGNNNEITVLELAKKIIQLLDSKSEIIFKDLPEDDPKRRLPDISKIEDLIGWHPKIKLDEGIMSTTKWIQENNRSD